MINMKFFLHQLCLINFDLVCGYVSNINNMSDKIVCFSVVIHSKYEIVIFKSNIIFSFCHFYAFLYI